MVISHGSRAWLFRRSVDWKVFALLFTCAFPFILIGVFTYVSLSEAAVGLFLGILLLITIPLRRLLKGRKIAMPRSAIGVVAVPYGFLSGASFGVGLILGPVLLGAGVIGETLIATLAVQGFLLNTIKSIAFGFSPLLTPKLIAIGIGMGICTFPGHYISRKIVRKTSLRVHTVLLEVVMVIGALYFLSRWFAT
ncbi:hypothetical protein AB833_06340 [Chromatiales bacterium (ex Bugula neritina AB1)]|nr:hypothetical protein AB833_06340 [Chromatiales bacterium (ex Bugula neritina AB1)]